jgi:hypothetical protein
MKTILLIDENRDVFTFADIKDAAEYIATESRWQDEFASEYLAYDISGDEPVRITHSVNGDAKDYWREHFNPEADNYHWQTLNNTRD